MYIIINVLIFLAYVNSTNCQGNINSQLLPISTEDSGYAAEYHSTVAEIFSRTPLDENNYSSKNKYLKEKSFLTNEKSLLDEIPWKMDDSSLLDLNRALEKKKSFLSSNPTSPISRWKINSKAIEEQKNTSSSDTQEALIKNNILPLHPRF